MKAKTVYVRRNERKMKSKKPKNNNSEERY